MRDARTLGDAELEAALGDLGRALITPRAPDLARTVRLRIASDDTRAASGSFPWRRPIFGRPLRRAVVVALAAVLVVAGVATALGLGLPGLRFVFFGPTAAPTTLAPTATSPPGDLELGRAVDPATLNEAAGYEALLPTLPELGPPLAVYIDRQPPDARVSAIYPAHAGFPAATGSQVAVLVSQFPGHIEGGFFQKQIGPDTAVEPVTVGGRPGFWVSGKPHQLMYVDPEGAVKTDSIRLVGNVLAWTAGDLTVRIEGAADLATALRIAASMH
ncbi:MAG: hypothetical protein M3R05_07570 [Chloroflexota bacterium]|nr:hypothetical protein [Chloroflexota bacterium]